MSHQVSEGLIVGWRQLQQTLMDGLQSGLSILQFCGIKVQINVRLQSVEVQGCRCDGRWDVGGGSWEVGGSYLLAA